MTMWDTSGLQKRVPQSQQKHAAAHRRLNTPPSQMLSSGPNTVALHTNRFSSLVGLALHLHVARLGASAQGLRGLFSEA